MQNSPISLNVDNGLGFLPGTGTFNISSLGGGGALVLADTAGGAVTVSLGRNGMSTTYSGAISGIGGLTKVGSGAATLAGNNSYAGATTINAGALVLAHSNAVLNSTVYLNADNGLAFGSGIGSFNVGGLSGSNALALVDTASNPITFNVGGNGQSTIYSGNLTGAGSLVKMGTGRLTLVGGGILYQGNTTVSGGTLELHDAYQTTMNAGNDVGFSAGNVTANTLTINSGAVLNFYVTSNFTAGGGTSTTPMGNYVNPGEGFLPPNPPKSGPIRPASARRQRLL